MRLILYGVTKSFDKVKVLKGATALFETGSVHGILGPKGSGKSTLINCITGEDNIDSGSIQLLDETGDNVFNYNQIGVAFSVPVLPNFLTCNEMIRFFIEANRDKLSADIDMDECFKFVNIEIGDRYRLIEDCSDAVKYKLQLLCVILANPTVIILDEPTILYDAEFTRDLREILRALTQDHIIIIATNKLESIQSICDNIMVLNKGELNILQRETLNNDEVLETVKDLVTEDEGELQ